jgi:hypothetical protein
MENTAFVFGNRAGLEARRGVVGILGQTAGDPGAGEARKVVRAAARRFGGALRAEFASAAEAADLGRSLWDLVQRAGMARLIGNRFREGALFAREGEQFSLPEGGLIVWDRMSASGKARLAAIIVAEIAEGYAQAYPNARRRRAAAAEAARQAAADAAWEAANPWWGEALLHIA